MSKFHLFGDGIIGDLSISRESIFISDVKNMILDMPEKSEFIVEQNGKMISCRCIPPNSFFTFKQTLLNVNQRIHFITDMLRLCKGDKRCVFENHEHDRYSITSMKILDGKVILIASNSVLISQESLLGF